MLKVWKVFNFLRNRCSTSSEYAVVSFTGEYPCDRDGNLLVNLVNASNTTQLAGGIIAQHTFSSKPRGGYQDFYEKMTTYIAILSGPAQSLDPKADAKTFRPIESKEEESVFKYVDTATSRAGIYEVSKKLEPVTSLHTKRIYFLKRIHSHWIVDLCLMVLPL